MNHSPYLWIMAGSDSSGAAGLQADLKTATSLGVHAATIITALTAQNPGEVLDIEPTSKAMLERQIEALLRYSRPQAIKTGMLGSPVAVRALAERLDEMAAPLILDPVMVSSSGHALADSDTIAAIKELLLPKAAVITPNAPEAALLAGRKIESLEDLQDAANALMELGTGAVVLKGGHLGGAYSHDFVVTPSERFWMSGPRHQGQISGTGCCFATALAAHLARGFDLADATVAARAYVSRGIRKSEPLVAGERQSPLWHGPWPVDAIDMPKVSKTGPVTEVKWQFPQIEAEDLGFYPIVTRAAQVRELVRLRGLTIQLRIKDLSGEALEREITEAVDIGRKAGARLYINDYWELAIKAGAYGVHLGQEDLDDADLDAIAKAGLKLGVSTHSYYEAARAAAIAPSYVALGPIHETTCKSMRFGPQGIDRIREWKKLFPFPLVAIGGLKIAEAPEVFGAGADGLAFISDLPAYLTLLESQLAQGPQAEAEANFQA